MKPLEFLASFLVFQTENPLGDRGLAVRDEVGSPLAINPEEVVQLVRGSLLGLGLEDGPDPPLRDLGAGGEEVEDSRTVLGELVPGEEAEEHLVEAGQLLLVLHTVILETRSLLIIS